LRGPKAGDTTSIIAAALIGIPVVALSLGLAFFMRSRKNKLANKQTVQGTTHAPFSDLSANKESGWRDNVDCTEHLSCTGVGENVDSDASNNERIMSQSFRIKKVKEKGKSSKYVTIPESESLVI
jgi:LPXTG-motif cell wall-anchored protein